MTAYPVLTTRVDAVTRAILETEGATLQDVIHRYDQTYDGYECNDEGLVRHDEFAVPELRRTTSETYIALNAYLRCGGGATLYGVDQNADGTYRDPLVMVHDVNLGETAGLAAVGRPLRDVVTLSHPALELLGGHTVTAVVDGDARATGGHAFCHIHLGAAWTTDTLHMPRR